MSGAASKAVARNVRFASMPKAVRTPKGLKLSSRGQRHAFCACRPRIASLPILPTLQGSNGSAPPGPRGFQTHRHRRFHLRLLTLLPLRGSWQRSNLFESHWSNQWLTFGIVNRCMCFTIHCSLFTVSVHFSKEEPCFVACHVYRAACCRWPPSRFCFP